MANSRKSENDAFIASKAQGAMSTVCSGLQ